MIFRDLNTLSKVDKEVGSVSAIVRSGDILDVCGYIDPGIVERHNFNMILFTDGSDRYITGIDLPSDGYWWATVEAGKIDKHSSSPKLQAFAASESSSLIFPLHVDDKAMDTYSEFVKGFQSVEVKVDPQRENHGQGKKTGGAKLRVFYLGAPSTIKLPSTASVSDLFAATGHNTGNMLIGHAIKRHIDAQEISSDFSLSHKNIEDNFDLIVIGAANFIAPFFDFEVYAKFLDSVKLPCVIIGLGAQARNYGERVQVPKGTERMLRIIAERSVSLGVRGYFTAVNLYDMGIKNVRVIGCPSMYWTCQPSLDLRWLPGRKPLAVAVNGSGRSITQSFNVPMAEKIEATIARLSYKQGYPYILQNETALMEIARGEEAKTEAINILLKRYGFTDQSPETFARFAVERMKSYFDVDQWVDAIRQFDFVIGTRFHGCLIALLAGIPCFVFVHDSRTREMCELLKIPHVDVSKANDIDINALYEALDLTSLKTAYRVLFQNYISFLEENHVDHRLMR